MEKKWRNLLIIIVLILLAVGIYLFSNSLFVSTESSSKTAMNLAINNVFEKNNYPKELFFSEVSSATDFPKLLRLRGDFESIPVPFDSDSNEAALRDYYIVASDLKLTEKDILSGVEKYALDENYYCEYVDEILDLDLNMSSLNSKYVGLKTIENDYGLSNFVGSFDENRFVVVPDLYSRFANHVFKVCAAFSAGLGDEE